MSEHEDCAKALGDLLLAEDTHGRNEDEHRRWRETPMLLGGVNRPETSLDVTAGIVLRAETTYLQLWRSGAPVHYAWMEVYEPGAAQTSLRRVDRTTPAGPYPVLASGEQCMWTIGSRSPYILKTGRR